MTRPRLRFRRNDGTEFPEWGVNLLGSIATNLKGAPLSKSDICEDGTPFILYGELYTTYGEVATDIVRRTKKVVSEEYLSRVGDVLIPTSGESPEEISTATCVMVPGVILAGDLYIVRNNVLNGCVLSYILNHQVNGDIAKIAQGKSIVHLRWDDLKKVSITYPTEVEEQQKIADFLSDLDAVISASEAEVAALEQQKKGAMQKIFSQEVRFRRDDGTEYPAWNNLQMDKVFTEIVDKNHPELPVLSVQQGVGTILRDKSDRRIEYDKKNLSGYKAMKPGDFIIHLRTFEGGLECANHEGISSPAYRILRSDIINSTVYRHYFRSYDFIVGKLSVAVVGIRDGKSIDMDTFWQIIIPVPCPEEQQKIADFLSSFDEAIALAQQELDKWKLLKKGLMQQMFV